MNWMTSSAEAIRFYSEEEGRGRPESDRRKKEKKKKRKKVEDVFEL